MNKILPKFWYLRVVDEEVDGLVGGDLVGSRCALVDVFVDDVLELTAQHSVRHQELLLVDVLEQLGIRAISRIFLLSFLLLLLFFE